MIFNNTNNRKLLVVAHVLALILIFSDNIILFRYIKSNSDQIKQTISRVEIFKYLSSTLIRDLNYRKIQEETKSICDNSLYVSKNKFLKIEKGRLYEIETFFNHYKESKSILSNTIFLGDLINEFMNNQVDTLFLPFIGDTKYCYDIMSTQWCQHETVELFIYPAKLILKSYNPVLSKHQYSFLKNIIDVSACGSNNVIINLIIDKNNYLSKNYYLYVYENEAFITTEYLVSSI